MEANSNPEVEVYSYVNLVLLGMTLRSSGAASAGAPLTAGLGVKFSRQGGYRSFAWPGGEFGAPAKLWTTAFETGAPPRLAPGPAVRAFARNGGGGSSPGAGDRKVARPPFRPRYRPWISELSPATVPSS